MFILGGALLTAIIGAVDAKIAANFAQASAQWLKGIPETFYELVAVLGGGYILARSADKYAKAKQAQAEAVQEFTRTGAPASDNFDEATR